MFTKEMVCACVRWTVQCRSTWWASRRKSIPHTLDDYAKKRSVIMISYIQCAAKGESTQQVARAISSAPSTAVNGILLRFCLSIESFLGVFYDFPSIIVVFNTMIRLWVIKSPVWCKIFLLALALHFLALVSRRERNVWCLEEIDKALP